MDEWRPDPLLTIVDRHRTAAIALPVNRSIVSFLLLNLGAAALVPALACQSASSTFRVHAPGIDASTVAAVHDDLRSGEARIREMLGAFPGTVAVRILPDREAFTAALRDAWGLTETACWMVGAADANGLYLLSPAVWGGAQVCDHDPRDASHRRMLVAHELVHVYHGQVNPTADIGELEELGWFIEGLATYVSGQLEASHGARAREAVAAGAVPERLAEAWFGPCRYSVTGSMASYIDGRWGRPVLREAMGVTSQAALLALLGVIEAELIGAWRDWVSAPAVDHHQHLLSERAARLNPFPFFTAADLVAMLDEAGIGRAVVLSLAYQYGNPNRPPVDDEYGHVRAENDWTGAEVARFPDRLTGYALEELARCARHPNLAAGLKLHFGNSDVDLADPSHVERVRGVFRAANEHGMAIVVHIRSSVTRQRPYGARQARTFLDELLPAAPDVTVQIAHLAGAGGYADPGIDEALGVFVDAIADGDPRMARVYFDVSGVLRPGQPEAVRERVALRIRQLGIERVLYGTDGAVPGNTPREAWARLRELPLTEAELRAIAGNGSPPARARGQDAR